MTQHPYQPPKIFLCVDDDPDFIAYFLSSAEPLNITIQTCGTLEEARKKLFSTDYDAYIVDLNLSDGFGITFVQDIRKKYGNKALIAVISGFYSDPQTFKLLKDEYKVQYVLDKPICPQQIDTLLTNLCQQSLPESTSPSSNKLQELKASYDRTISDKIELFTNLIKAAQAEGDQEALIQLRDAAHKIGGSAGTYGYHEVSNCCKEMEYLINEKSSSGLDKDWLLWLDDYLRSIKYHFQIISPSEMHFKKSSVSYIRPSLYVVDSDVKFLELLQGDKEHLTLDFFVESDPKKAKERLKSPDFNPRVVVVAEVFPGSSVKALDIIEAARTKMNYLPTIFALLLSTVSIDGRINALNCGVDYIFHRPISAKVLLKHVVDVLELRALHSFKVLVLDDDKDICIFISAVLSEIGIDVRTICDPALLFETLEEYHPQMLLLDLLMPKYDGLSLLRTLRADSLYQNLIISIITFRSDHTTQLMAFSANVDDIFYKPLDKTLLQKRVLNLARRQGALRHPLEQDTTGLADPETLPTKVGERLAMPEYPPHYPAKSEIILIDPDEDFLKILKAAFESHHLVVKTFNDGQKALGELLARKENQLPALIISERKLSDMDGLEILKKLQAHFDVPIPFYFLTVFSSEKDVTMGLKGGAVDYIAKPFNLSILIQKVLKTISHSR